MSLLQAGFGASGDDDYTIDDSLRFRSASDAYLNRTFSTPTNNKKWSYSVWMKRGTLSTNQAIISSNVDGANYWDMRFNTSDQIYIQNRVSSSNLLVANTTAVYRDPSSWYHIMFVFDSANSTASNRNRLYINSVEQTLSANSGSSNASAWNVNAVQHNLGVARTLSSSGAIWAEYDGYQTEINFVDGQALTPTDFGEYDTNGTWKPLAYTGTYGNNGFYLPMKPTTQATGFNTVLYTGTGGTQSINGVGFSSSPDLVWIKNRSGAASHIQVDSVRGIGAELSSNSTGAETSNGTSRLTSFDSDGFTISSTAVSSLNTSGNTYVAWCWDAGSGSAGTNTAGDINSTVKANPATGFSIVSYTGNGSNSTVGHGLNTAPEVVIVKDRDRATDWPIMFKAANNGNGQNGWIRLNLTAAWATTSILWNNTAPTSSVFSIGTYDYVNFNNSKYIAYCFAPVEGYSKFGSYSGTGSAGKSVTGLGFQPAWLMIKCSSTASTPWVMYDNTREPDNDNNDLVLQADNSSAEIDGGGTTRAVTFDSDGFTLDTTYGGNNGSGRTYIYMAFADTADARFNFDASGNQNNWEANNINSNAESETTYDLMKDTPSLVDENAANFAVMNPIDKNDGSYTDGNLGIVTGTVGGSTQRASMYFNSGKYYWEYTPISNGGISAPGFETLNSGTFTSQFYQADNGQYYNGSSASSYGATFGNNDVIGIAVDVDNRTVQFFKNGASQGTISSSNSGISVGDSIIPYVTDRNVGQTTTAAINFGQRPFAYTPPSGFLKLNTFNLPDSTIEKGDDYFNTVLWTGTGSGQSITGMNFQPDWLWFKQRNGTSGHALIDSVRGVNQGLVSNTTAAEVTSGANNDLVSFDSDGFTTGTPQYFGSLGSNNNTIVTWSWRAGSTTTNTAGSEDSVISANTTAGFSIVSYTGTGANMTIGHGLGAVPSAMIFKIRNSADNWAVWHNSFAVNQYVYLNNTTAKATVSTFMNGTLPTSTLISLGTWATVNYTASHNYIAYCFTEKEGYSSFGSYTGNGSADGPFVYTGFRPAMIMVKRFDTTNNWLVHDNKRDPYNQVVNGLIPNSANAEFVGNSANYGFDFVSNGFKAKGTTGGGNDSGGSYIYMAFAENPFKNSNAR